MLVTRNEGYLAKAKEAEELAARTADLQAKQTWLLVAQGYRDLAARDTGIDYQAPNP